MKITKKLFATFLSALLSVSIFVSPVCAANTQTTTPVVQEQQLVTPSSEGQQSSPFLPCEEILARQSVGKLLAGGQKTIYGGTGIVEVYLDSGNWWTDVMCGTASSSASGSVSCYITFPDGDTTYLGTIRASADHTDYTEFTHCPAGLYKFTFESNTSDAFDAYARMYD